MCGDADGQLFRRDDASKSDEVVVDAAEIVNNVAHRLEFDLGDDPHDVLEATSMSAYVGPSGTSISAL